MPVRSPCRVSRVSGSLPGAPLKYLRPAPEQLRDVLHGAVRSDPVKALVGRRRRQRPQLLDPASQLDVVERLRPQSLRQPGASRIPACVQHREFPPHDVGQRGDLVRCGVPAHETDAGHRAPVAGEYPAQLRLVEHPPHVGLQVRAVAPAAAVGAVGDVDRQRRFAGYFREYDVEIMVSDHRPFTPLWRNSGVRPPSGARPRSSTPVSCSRSRGSGSPGCRRGTRGTPSGSACRCARTRCIPCWEC